MLPRYQATRCTCTDINIQGQPQVQPHEAGAAKTSPPVSVPSQTAWLKWQPSFLCRTFVQRVLVGPNMFGLIATLMLIVRVSPMPGTPARVHASMREAHMLFPHGSMHGIPQVTHLAPIVTRG